jgi:hypothetical protein
MTSLPGRILWWIIAVITGPFLIGPIALYAFFESVYNFGPRHRQRSVWQILFNPDPDASYYVNIDDMKLVKMFRPNRCRRRIVRSKRYCSAEDYHLHRQRIRHGLIDCKYNNIDPASTQHLNLSTFSMPMGSVGTWNIYHGVIPSISAAFSRYLSSQVVFSLFPRKPPDGLIARSIVLMLVIAIYSGMTISGCFRIWRYALRESISQFMSNARLNAVSSWNTFIGHISNLLASTIIKCPESKRVMRIYATTNMDDDVDNQMATFDTDSSFWICDNSATGHICKDITLFHGELTPSIFDVGSATGKTSPDLMGNIQLRLMDDEGADHVFNLTNVQYVATSPFNIMSVRLLAEQFTDSEGRIDHRGTGIISLFEEHTLFWNRRKYKKTFYTSQSGLPECLFNTGYSRLHSYASKVAAAYDDTIHWSFVSENMNALHSSSDEDRVGFIHGMKLLYNSGNGVKDVVTFLGNDYVDGMQRRCNIQRSNGTTLLVIPETLAFIENPDIASIPETTEQFASDARTLTTKQLKDISQPQTLSPLQEEMMSYHTRMHHLPFPKMLVLAENGTLPKRFTTLKGRTPICVSCIFGTAHRRPWRTKSKTSHPIRKKSDIFPGACTSVDQIVSAQPGLIPQMSGKLTILRVNGATIFVDHHSDLVYAYLMRNLTLEETILAKRAFERFAASVGVVVHGYHADNGRFADKGFRDDCTSNNQTISFCAVGAHHQNGIAERKIKDLTLGARTLLLHAKRMLPEYITTILWPFALKCFEDRMNNLMHRADGRTPYQTFASLDATPIDINNFHTFGCPCYVLDHRLQSGSKMIPKWEPRSRMGIYVGRSPSHASNVGLILNPRTGHVSPQFHVIYDDDFTTVKYLRTGTVPPHWSDLVRDSSEIQVHADTQASTWQSLPELVPEEGDFASDVFELSTNRDGNVDPNPNDTLEQLPVRDREGELDVTIMNHRPANSVTYHDAAVDSSSAGDSNNALSSEWQMPQAIDLERSGLRRSARVAASKAREQADPERSGLQAHTLHTSNPGKKIAANVHPVNLTFKRACQVIFGMFCTISIGTLWSLGHTVSAEPNQSLFSNAIDSFHRVNQLYDGTLNCFSTVAASALASNETFTYKQAMQQDDYRDFIKAMITEVDDHEQRGHWTLMERRCMPSGTKTIMSIWSFKRKRYPDGTLNKHKARLCAHGGMQTWGQNYWETYAPVVNWASVRILFAVAKIHNLPSKSIDFVLAFPQAELEIPVYMELPIGFESPDGLTRKLYVLRLNKSLYGLKQASYNWFNKLSTGLQERGFIPSSVDPCVFFSKGCIVLTYVDDCIIVGDSISTIDSLIKSLHGGDDNFIFTEDEGSIDKYLGVEIKQLDANSFSLTQPFLIERILRLLGIEDGKTNDRITPVGKPLLNKDLNGEPRKHTWEYRAAIGMLTYLTGSVRPDIAMAVHQCARFSINPMRSHELAVMRIGRYLLSSKDKGMIFTPDATKGLEVFVDADFAGGWDPTTADDADTVYSRTGFVIRYAGCPLLWTSKLQTEIALSTAEAEYIAMSQALRETIPLMNLMQEMNVIFKLHIPQPKFVVRVHEDNQSCIAMANNPKFTPRTKHIAIKYHHFRKHVITHANPDGFIEIVYCDTNNQVADIFTKPTTDETFLRLRKLLLKW